MTKYRSVEFSVIINQVASSFNSAVNNKPLKIPHYNGTVEFLELPEVGSFCLLFF